MDFKAQGKVALITGASRGIGRATALALAREGIDVALLGRDVDLLEQTAGDCAALGVGSLPLAADLADTAGLKQLVPRVVDKFGELNILINNAGVMDHGPVETGDTAVWDNLIDVNIRGLLHLTRLCLPQIVKHHSGAVISISSRSGKFAFANLGAYCASKHAVVGFSHALFEEVRDRGVKVCAICPGLVKTDMVTAWDLDFSKALLPEDVAQSVVYVLASSATGCPTEIILNPQKNPYA